MTSGSVCQMLATSRRWPGWLSDPRQSFAHVWPRFAGKYVPDLWTRLPEGDWIGPRKLAALTFDDGPSDAGTPELLEILEKAGAKATFFLIGENARRFPHRVREIVAAGHSLGNHFRRHIDCWKRPPREVIREVTEGGRILEDIAGISTRWCRPPYGRLTHAVVKWSRIHRQQIVLWDVFPPDYRTDSTVSGLKQVLLGRLRQRSVICLHDNDVSISKTPQLLRETLGPLCQDGWDFIPMDDCPEAVPLRK